MTSENDIVKKAGKKDLESFKLLVGKYSRWLLALSSTICGKEDAEEIGQEIWIIVWEKLGKLEDPSKFKSWLRTIVIRESLKRKRSHLKIASGNNEIEVDSLETEVASTDKVISARRQLLAILTHISPEQRLTLFLSEVEGMSIKEIADELGLPEGTVKSRLHNTKKKLNDVSDIKQGKQEAAYV